MKQNTDSRLLKAKEVTKDQLINKIKSSDTTRFDQMLIESEERKTYYYVKYKALAYTREPKTLKFPLFKDWVNDFERTIEQSGEPEILQDDRLIQKVISKGYSSIDTRKYAGKNLVFSELKLVLDGDKIKTKQPLYYIPNETERNICETCVGEKYTICDETECRGQHIYDCNKCNATGEIECNKCSGHGEYNCKKCNSGWIKCTSCSGKGEDKCSHCSGKGYNGGPGSNSAQTTCRHCSGRGYSPCGKCSKKGEIRCSNCNGGIIKCGDCKARGRITCSKCTGKRQITCHTCYGDHKDNRYGKVDCKTCETAGELASISYIETEIKSDNLDLIFTDGKKIDAPNFGVDSIKKYANTNGQLALTYKNLNGENKDAYDDYSTFCSKNALPKIGASKDKYPKLITEEMYYEGVPCSTFNYNHILSATFHDVSVISVDKEQDVLFHSNPTAVAEEKESVKENNK